MDYVVGDEPVWLRALETISAVSVMRHTLAARSARYGVSVGRSVGPPRGWGGGTVQRALFIRQSFGTYATNGRAPKVNHPHQANLITFQTLM